MQLQLLGVEEHFPHPCCEGRVHLAQCINPLVLESQLPYKAVHLIFLPGMVNKELTILWGI